MQHLCLLLVAFVAFSTAAPIETSTSSIHLDIEHTDQEAENALRDIENLNEAVQAASADGATLNVNAVNELVADVEEQLKHIQDDEHAGELKEQLRNVLNDAVEVISTEGASIQETPNLDALHETIEQLAEETGGTTSAHVVHEGEAPSSSLLVEAPHAENIQNDATEDLVEKVEVLPVSSGNNDAPHEGTILQELSEVVEGSGQEQIGQNDIDELLDESTPAHEDKTSELVFADQKTTHQQIDVEAVDPLAEQLVINIPLSFTVDQVLSRLNRMVFESPTNERLYIAMKLTEMSHSLMRSVDSELEETQTIR